MSLLSMGPRKALVVGWKKLSGRMFFNELARVWGSHRNLFNKTTALSYNSILEAHSISMYAERLGKRVGLW
jgi:hypothetical protein